MNIKNRLDKLAAALSQSREQHIVKIDDRQGVEPTGWRHVVDTSGGGWQNPKTIYSVDDARFDTMTGLHIFFAEYGD